MNREMHHSSRPSNKDAIDTALWLVVRPMMGRVGIRVLQLLFRDRPIIGIVVGGSDGRPQVLAADSLGSLGIEVDITEAVVGEWVLDTAAQFELAIRQLEWSLARDHRAEVGVLLGIGLITAGLDR